MVDRGVAWSVQGNFSMQIDHYAEVLSGNQHLIGDDVGTGQERSENIAEHYN